MTANATSLAWRCFVALTLIKIFPTGKFAMGDNPWYGRAGHYWSLNSVQGGRVTDLKGKKLSEVYAVEPIDGYSKKGLRIIDKAGSGIVLGDFEKTCLSNPNLCDDGFTITFWLKLRTTAYSRKYNTIIQITRRELSVGTALFIHERTLSFYVNSPERTRKLSVLWDASYWTHVSLVWNKTADRSDMYFNGTHLMGAKRSVFQDIFSGDVPPVKRLTVGANYLLMHNTDMMIDEVAIWYQPLSLEELSSIYAAKAVDGGYSPWSNYSRCTVSCGGGTSHRTRTCTNPRPQHGGFNCSSPSQETITCNTQPCPIHGSYSLWSEFTPCSLSCGGGITFRSRNCTNPPPQYGGKDCSRFGASLQERMCNFEPCPVNGGYTSWSNFTLCSVTCGNGTKTRHRNCTNPFPEHGGSGCEYLGLAREIKHCYEMDCPIDGNYSNWSAFSHCSVSCGGGTESRRRLCNNPPPYAGGRDCSDFGVAVNTRKCNRQDCPRNGNYTEWSKFSWPCSRTCGGGIQTRKRNCTEPPPQLGGENCTRLGPAEQNRPCNTQLCPVNGRYSDWSEWDVCSVTCGKGWSRRTRKCDSPSPQHGGSDCTRLGPVVENKRCNRSKCKDITIGILLALRGVDWHRDYYNTTSKEYRDLENRITNNIRSVYDEDSALSEINYETCDFYLVSGTQKTQCQVTLRFLDSKYQGIIKLQNVLANNVFQDGMPVAAQLYRSIDVEVAKPVTNVRVLTTGPRSLRVQWKKLAKRSTTRNITGYKVTYFDPQDRMWAKIVDGYDTTHTELSPLNIWTMYCVHISSLNERGEGIASWKVCNKTAADVPDGSPSNVTVKAISPTSLLVSWRPIAQKYVHGQLLGYHVKYRRAGSNEIGSRNLTNPSRNSILLPGLQTYTTYLVTVAAFNLMGFGILSEEVRGQTKEDVPSKVPRVSLLCNTSSTSIYLSWEHIPEQFINGHLLGYRIFYQLADATDDPGWSNETVGASENSTVITGLSKFTNYAVQVSGFTRVGDGVTSKAKFVMTDEDVPGAHPTKLQAFNSTNSTRTLLLVWGTVPKEQRHGIILGYKIFYRKTNGREFKEKLANPKSEATELTDLEKFTKYEVGIVAFTSKGEGKRSQLRIFLTSEDIPSKPPILMHLHNTSSTSIRISWQQIPQEYIHGILKGYRVLYRLMNETEEVYKSVKTADLYVELNGLLKYSYYGIRVLGFTAVGDGRSSAEEVCRTDEDVPSWPPEDIIATNKSAPTKIPIFWQPISNSYYVHGILLGYRVLYRAVRNPNKQFHQEDRLITVDAKTLSVVITGLESFTVYSVRVLAYTIKGNGTPSTAIRAETCNCHKTLYTSWWAKTPYTGEDRGNVNGMFPSILSQATFSCCGFCAEHNETLIDFHNSGLNKTRSQKRSEQEVKNFIEDHTELNFPVTGIVNQRSYSGTYGFVSLVKSAGAAFIILAEDSDSQTQKLVGSVFDLWPLFMSMLMSVVISGLLIWILDCCFNKDIPASPFRGPLEGMWWSFVTMTTVGYGDRVPQGFYARIYGLLWILCGLVIVALVMSFVTTSLTTEVMTTDVPVYGTQIAAIQNSSEYRLGVRMMGKMDQGVIYRNLMDVYWALKNKRVKGALIDVYTVGSRQELFSDPSFRVNKIISVPSEYGVVMAGDAIKLQNCFREFLKEERVAVSNTISSNVRPLTELEQTSAQETTKGLFDHKGKTYISTMIYVCSTIGVCILLGIVYEIRTRKWRNPNPQRYDYSNLEKDKSKDDCFYVYMESKKMMENILQEFHKNCELKIKGLRVKHERERRHLARIKMEEHQAYNGTQKSTLRQRFGTKHKYKNGLIVSDANGNAI